MNQSTPSVNTKKSKHLTLTKLNKQSLLKIKNSFFLNNDRVNHLTIALMVAFGIVFFFLVMNVVIWLKPIGADQMMRNNWMNASQMVLTGFALGISSYLLQRVTNNKLADTAVMGFGNFNLIPIAILALCTNLSMDPSSTKMDINTYKTVMPIVVVCTSLLLCTVFNFASKEKVNFNFKKLLLSGIILNFVSVAIAFSIVANADPKSLSIIERKTIGFIGDEPFIFNFYFSGACILVGFIWIMLNSWKLKLIIQNQQIATQVGVKNKFTLCQMMLAIGLLVGASYSLSGDFVFVGLMAGNIAFKISKNKVHYGVLTSGLTGALMVLITYFIFSNLINVPGNIIAPLIPLLISPYFIYLVIVWR
ncbi:iron chelate uptake ABC transporter family permease subunit [Ureaplasma ceti]|uniref:Iron ABC transporter permease n=1 Tax=Ureaplasma ceti TaxID=3119530 RepID=A0ABP9U9B8_9BACT